MPNANYRLHRSAGNEYTSQQHKCSHETRLHQLLLLRGQFCGFGHRLENLLQPESPAVGANGISRASMRVPLARVSRLVIAADGEEQWLEVRHGTHALPGSLLNPAQVATAGLVLCTAANAASGAVQLAVRDGDGRAVEGLVGARERRLTCARKGNTVLLASATASRLLKVGWFMCVYARHDGAQLDFVVPEDAAATVQALLDCGAACRSLHLCMSFIPGRHLTRGARRFAAGRPEWQRSTVRAWQCTAAS